MKLNNPKDKHVQYAVKECVTLEGHPQIKGYDFEQPFNFQDFLKAYALTGFQATHLAQGIEIAKAMRREKARIFLSFTSNQVSSGNREIIKYLVKNKKVDVLVTSAGGVEEDIIKCLKQFVLGNFNVSGRMMFENGINRIGNIFVPNDRFAYFDKFMREFFEKIYEKQKKNNRVYCPNE